MGHRKEVETLVSYASEERNKQKVRIGNFDIVEDIIEKENDVFRHKFGDDSDWIYSEYPVYSVCLHKAYLCENSFELIQAVSCKGISI